MKSRTFNMPKLKRSIDHLSSIIKRKGIPHGSEKESNYKIF